MSDVQKQGSYVHWRPPSQAIYWSYGRCRLIEKHEAIKSIIKNVKTQKHVAKYKPMAGAGNTKLFPSQDREVGCRSEFSCPIPLSPPDS